MNCNRFDQRVADWLTGKLDFHESDLMQAHAASCEACSRLVAMEQEMMAAFRSMPELNRSIDLTTKLEEKLKAPALARPLRPSILLRLGTMLGLVNRVGAPKPFALGSATATAGALCALVVLTLPVAQRNGVNSTPNRSIQVVHDRDHEAVKRITEMVAAHDPDKDETWAIDTQYRPTERLILTGSGGD